MENRLDAAVRILRSAGLNAGIADTGGGNLCVVVAGADEALDEPRFVFGTAAEKWAAEVASESPGLWTDVASDEESPAEVARGILVAIARWSQSQWSPPSPSASS